MSENLQIVSPAELTLKHVYQEHLPGAGQQPVTESITFTRKSGLLGAQLRRLHCNLDLVPDAGSGKLLFTSLDTVTLPANCHAKPNLIVQVYYRERGYGVPETGLTLSFISLSRTVPEAAERILDAYVPHLNPTQWDFTKPEKLEDLLHTVLGSFHLVISGLEKPAAGREASNLMLRRRDLAVFCKTMSQLPGLFILHPR